MPLPALIPAIASALAWIGIDLGISYLTSDTTDVSYVTGLDFHSFLESYWLSLLLYVLMMVMAVVVATPKQQYSNNGPGPRRSGRTNQFDNMNKRILALLIACFAALSCCIAVLDNGTDATGDLSSTYGEPTNINMGPGYQWTYTPEFPEDLVEYITVSLEVNEGQIGTINGSTVTVFIPLGTAVGTVFDVVIKATMTSPVQQSATQYVTFTVVNALDVSGTLNDIISGSNIDFSPIATTGMGEVVWQVKSGTTLPAGLILNDGTVSGTPTGIGLQTISLTASAGGQSKDLVVSFTVWSAINSGEDEIIYSNNKTVSSAEIVNGEDIGVSWALTSGEIPEGFSLDSSTGVISGSSDVYQESIVTITGTTSHGPQQTATKQITIRSEPGLALVSPKTVYTYVGADPKTFAVSFNSNSSDRTWIITNMEGVSITEGQVSLGTFNEPGEHSLRITLRSAWGQMRAVTTTLIVEDVLTITGPSTLSLLAEQEGSTAAFTVTGGSDNVLTASTEDVGLSVRMADGKLYASDNSPDKDITVTVTATSAGGQTASQDVTVDVYSQLVFTSAPTGGAIIYAV